MSAPNGNGFPPALKFEVGKPVILALKFEDGKPCPNAKTDTLLFSTTDGHHFFCDPYVGERIRALGIAKGEPFQIEKVERFSGNRRTCELVVSPLRNAAASGQRPAASSLPAEHETPAPQPAPGPRPPAPAPVPVNGNGETHADLYVQCFRETVRIAPKLCAIAREAGWTVAPTFEDLRCIATHLSIGRKQ